MFTELNIQTEDHNNLWSLNMLAVKIEFIMITSHTKMIPNHFYLVASLNFISYCFYMLTEDWELLRNVNLFWTQISFSSMWCSLVHWKFINKLHLKSFKEYNVISYRSHMFFKGFSRSQRRELLYNVFRLHKITSWIFL